MAISVKNSQSPVGEVRNIPVPAPGEGRHLEIPSVAGGHLVLGFDPSDATFARNGNNLVLTLDNGGEVTLTDFFAVGDQGLPALQLPDGTLVASTDFLAASGIDLTTEAGQAPASGGSVSSYEADAGDLVGGVNALGSQDGLGQWGQPLRVGNQPVSQGNTPLVSDRAASATVNTSQPTVAAPQTTGFSLSVDDPDVWNAAAVVTVRHVLAIDTETPLSEVTLRFSFGNNEFIVTATQSATIDGQYGTLVIRYENGKFVAEYTLNDNVQGNGFRAADALAAGQIATEFEGLALRVINPDGQESGLVPVVINVVGTNDAPVIDPDSMDAGTTEGAFSDGSGQLVPKVIGTVGAVDPDDGSVLTYSIKNNYAVVDINGVPTTIGTFSIDPVTGAITLVPNDNIRKLAGNTDYTIKFTAVVTDGQGGIAEHNFSVIITGTNDAPVFGQATLLAPTEDAFTSGAASGALTPVQVATLRATDVDSPTLTYSLKGADAIVEIDGNLVNIGKFSINPVTGAVTLAPNDNINRLVGGADYTVKFTGVVSDGQGGVAEQPFSIKITGTNDAPVFGEAVLQNQTEDAFAAGPVQIATLHSADVDSKNLSYSLKGSDAVVEIDGQPVSIGTFKIDATGVVTLEANGNLDRLAGGKDYTVTFTGVVSDEHGGVTEQPFSVKITGTNDAPVFGPATLLAPTEDAFTSGAADGALTPVVVATLHATDIDSKSLTYSLKGADAIVEIDGNLVNIGKFGIDPASGAVTLAPNDNINRLVGGADYTVKFTGVVSDGQGGVAEQPFSINITGTNDAPVFGEAVLQNQTEDAFAAGPVRIATLHSADVDSKNLSYSLKGSDAVVEIDGQPVSIGTFKIDATGAVTLEANGNLDRLAGGKDYTVTFTGVVSDEHGGVTEQPFSVKITGTNDAPVFGPATPATQTEDAFTSGAADGALTPVHIVTLHATDIDSKSLTYSLNGNTNAVVNINGQPVIIGVFSIDPDNGAVKLVPNANINQLTGGKDYFLDLSATVSDGTGSDVQRFSVTITGTNDAPVASSASASVSEDSMIRAGSLAHSFTDADAEDAGHSFSHGVINYNGVAVSAEAAGFVLHEDGSWSINPKMDLYQSLGQGVQGALVVEFIVDDGHGGLGKNFLTINVTGTNDAPQATGAAVSVFEDGQAVSGNMADLVGDADAGDAHTFTYGAITYKGVAATPAELGLTLDKNGGWSLNPASDIYQSLAEGVKGDISITYTVKDSTGATATGTVTITVTGVNDMHTATPVVVAASEGGASVHGSLLTNVLDADSGDPKTFTYGKIFYNGVEVSPKDAGLILNANGIWSVDPKADLYHSLGRGDEGSLVVEYTAVDGLGNQSASTLTFNVSGSNTLPEFAPHKQVVVNEDTPAFKVGTYSATDADGDTLTYYMVDEEGNRASTVKAYATVAGEYREIGEYSIDGQSGEVSFTPNEILQALTTGEAPISNFTITVFDGYEYATTSGSIKVVGVNDGPTMAANGPVTEAGAGGATASQHTVFTYVDPEDNIRDLAPKAMQIDVHTAEGQVLSSTGGKLYFHYDPETESASWSRSAAGAYGELKYNPANGNVMFVMNDQAGGAAHKLPGDFSQSFRVDLTATDSSGLKGATTQLDLELKGSDDIVTFGKEPFTHDNESLILTPFIEQNPGNSFTGKINVSDVDDPKGTERFALFSGNGSDYSTGDWSSGKGVYTLENSVVTVEWKDGQWTYEYVSTATANTSGGVVLDDITVRAYDPDIYNPEDASTYQENAFTATVVTVKALPDAPQAIFDKLVVHVNADGHTDMLRVNDAAADPARGLNVLDNDQTKDGLDGARWDGNGWVANPMLTLPTALAGGTDANGVHFTVYQGKFGTLTLYADGRADYEPNPNSAGIKALGESNLGTDGNSVQDIFLYPVEENGKTTLGVLAVLVKGSNDAPELENIQHVSLNVNTSWEASVERPSETTIHLVLDPDRGDTHTFRFFTDENCSDDSRLADLGQHVSADYQLSDALKAMGYTYDPDKNGIEGAQVEVDGQHIFQGQYGWLVDNGDGTFKYVVNRADPKVIALADHEQLTETFYCKAEDAHGALSGSKEIRVTIDGKNDVPLVRAWGDDADDHSYKHSQGWLTDDKGQYFIVHVADINGCMTSDYYTNTIGHAGVIGKAGLVGNVVTLDGVDNNDVRFVPANVSLYAQIGVNDSPVYIGQLRMSENGTVGIWVADDYTTELQLRGEVTEFYTDPLCTKLFKGFTVETSHGGGAQTIMPVSNLRLVFADDAPTLYCEGGKVENIGDGVDFSGRLMFEDVEGEKLVLMVWDEALGDYKAITADNTAIQTKMGTLFVDRNGHYRYDAQDGANGLESIKVKVVEVADERYSGDQVNSIEGMLSLQVGNYVAQSGINLKDYTYNGVIDDNERGGSWNANALGLSGNKYVFLNPGIYEADNKVITFDGTSARGLAADQMSSSMVSGCERLEFKMPVLDISFGPTGNGGTAMSVGDGVEIYDRVTGYTFILTKASAPGIINWMQMNMDVDFETAKSMLQIRLPYQVLDTQTNDVLEGDFIVDLARLLTNSAPVRLGNNSSIIRGSSLGDYDHLSQLDWTVANTPLFRDGNIGDVFSAKITYGVPTLGPDGKLVCDPATMKPLFADATDDNPNSVLNYIESRGGSVDHATGAVSGNVTADIPIYANIDGKVVEIGTASFKITNTGTPVTIGYDPAGNPITIAGGLQFGNGYTVTLHDPNPNDPADPLWSLAQDMKDAHEGQFLDLGSIFVRMVDAGGLSSPTTVLPVQWTGKDVLMGNGSNGTLGYGLTSVFNTGTAFTEDTTSNTVNIMGGTKHTFTDDRTSISGWDNFVVNGQVNTEDLSATQRWEGNYGYLTWNPATNKFTYEPYKANDPLHGDAGKLVAGMHKGQFKEDVFEYTLTDKNGESGTGRVTVKVNGADDVFTRADGVNAGVAQTTVNAGNEAQHLISGSVGDLIQNVDSIGYDAVRYLVSFNGKVYGDGGVLTEIPTNWGVITFNSSTGDYVFQPNGVLQHGQVQNIDLKVQMQMGYYDGDGSFVAEKSSTAAGSSGIISRITLTGVNDAPELGDKTDIIDGLSTTHHGAVAWLPDPDDTGGFSITGSHGDISGMMEGGKYTIHGEHGDLQIDTIGASTFTYSYTIDQSSVHGRAIDVFDLTLHDAGSGKGAAFSQSDSMKLTLYAVDGDNVHGTGGDDVLFGQSGAANIFHSGAGNDVIDLANSHEDILVWKGGDANLVSHAKDTVLNFTSGLGDDADILDLSGLLRELKGPSENLSEMLSFKVDSGNTTICINDKDNTGSYQTVQEIVLDGVTFHADNSSSGSYEELMLQVRLITE